jgi:hypothetical protein
MLAAEGCQRLVGDLCSVCQELLVDAYQVALAGSQVLEDLRAVFRGALGEIQHAAG